MLLLATSILEKSFPRPQDREKNNNSSLKKLPEEITTVIKEMKDDKELRLNEIPPELLKLLDKEQI